MKPKPCARHQPKVIGYVVQLLMRSRVGLQPLYEVFEEGTCTRCGDALIRQISQLRAADGWEAARLAGVPEADIATVSVRGDTTAPSAAPAPSTSPPIAMRLSCWPFPVSTRYYRIKD